MIESEIGGDWRKTFCAAYAKRSDGAWLFFVRFDHICENDVVFSPGFFVYLDCSAGELHVVETEEVQDLWDYSAQLTLFRQKVGW